MAKSVKKLSGDSEPVNEMSKAAYARYRNVSKPMVSKWSADGRLVMSDDGKRVKVKESDQRIKETTHLNNWANEHKAKKERAEINKRIAESAKGKTVEELTTEVKQTQLDLETDNARELFENARALREKAAALQAEAEHQKFIGLLVPRDRAEKIFFERGRQFRDSLTTCARRVSPIITSINDSVEIENLLNKEFRTLLENFTKLPIVK